MLSYCEILSREIIPRCVIQFCEIVSSRARHFRSTCHRWYRWGKYRQRLLNTTSNGRNSRLLRAPVIRDRRRDASRCVVPANSNSLLGNRPFDQRHVTSKFRLNRTIDTFVWRSKCNGEIIGKRSILHTIIKNFLNNSRISNLPLGIFNIIVRS